MKRTWDMLPAVLPVPVIGYLNFSFRSDNCLMKNRRNPHNQVEWVAGGPVSKRVPAPRLPGANDAPRSPNTVPDQLQIGRGKSHSSLPKQDGRNQDRSVFRKIIHDGFLRPWSLMHIT